MCVCVCVCLAIELYEFLIYMDTNPLLDMWFENTFSHFVGCLYILFILSFALQKLFNLI